MSLRTLRSTLLVLIIVIALLWVITPITRVGLLLETPSGGHDPAPPPALAVQNVHFRATDGVGLHGWLVHHSPAAPTVLLIAGFRADRSTMVPYAHLLKSRYNVMLYDSRGTGGSGGSFSLGVREVDDVRGAIAFLKRRPDLPTHRYGLLGLSLGAGVAIVAAAHEPSVLAIVADSAYADQEAVVRFDDYLHFRTVSVPLAPLGPWAADRILGTPLASFSPLREIAHIAPRHVLLIHSLHDTNPTTPLSDVMKLKHAGGATTSLWIAPRGPHAGAYAAQPGAYAHRVLSFFDRYLLH
jgi:uncharacterized protein